VSEPEHAARRHPAGLGPGITAAAARQRPARTAAMASLMAAAQERPQGHLREQGREATPTAAITGAAATVAARGFSREHRPPAPRPRGGAGRGRAPI